MRKTAIGGAALIEGLMMIGTKEAAIAVRKPDGDIVLEKKPLPARNRWLRIPVVRGSLLFFRQMLLVTQAMMFSAGFIEVDEGDETGFLDELLEKIFGDRLKDAIVYFSLILSFAFSIGLFILLPNILAGLLPFDKDHYTGMVYYNFFEGILRILLFFGYLAIFSRTGDMKRVWEYHGAEHKTINCYEHGEALTVGNVMRYSTKNPRCGTSYMFFVVLVSIVVYSFLSWYGLWLNILLRLALVPVIAGLSFEILKFAGDGSSKLAQLISLPGLLFQRFTTREPDERQVEVAILAFQNVLVQD